MTDPFAPVAPASTVQVPCPECGRSFSPTQGHYGAHGQLVCPSCPAGPSLRAVEHKNHRSMFVGSLASVGIGLLSVCIQHRFLFFLFPLLAMGSGVVIFATALRNEDAKRALGGLLIPTLIASALGAVIGLLSLSLSLLARFAFS